MEMKFKIKNLLKPRISLYSPVSVLSESKILEGRNIIITGGSSGIGRSIAITCARGGVRRNYHR